MSTATLGKAAGAVLALGGMGAIYLQMTTVDEAKVAAMPEEVKRNPLKKTLSNAGLYPEPQAKGLKSIPSGSMAVFEGKGAGLGKGNGTSL
jgi:hypothetical protein